MMNSQCGGGSADKKEKTTLLREITYLTRLIQQHDYKNKPASRLLGVSIVKNQVSKNKRLNIHQMNSPSIASYGGTVQTSSHGIQKMSLPPSHSVFVNPKKLNCQLLDTTNSAQEQTQKQYNVAAVNIKNIPHRVYINPNFKKEESPTNKPVFKFVAGHGQFALGTVKKNIYVNKESKFGNKIIQNVKNVLPANSNNKNTDIYKFRKSQKAVSNINVGQLNKVLSYKKHSLSSSNCLASMSRDSQVNIMGHKPQSLIRKALICNSEPKVVPKSEIAYTSQTSDGNICSCRDPLKGSAEIGIEKTLVQKLEIPKAASVAAGVHSLKESCEHSEMIPENETECQLKSNGNSKRKSSGLCASLQPQKMRDVKHHRRRSSSTCLVAVSKTKLVRKHKVDISSLNVESNKGVPGQKKKLVKVLQPLNRYKLNKLRAIKIKNMTPKTYCVNNNNNPFRLVKFKPGTKALPVKTTHTDKFNLVRHKPNVSSNSSNKFKLIVAQKNMKQAHCPVENVTLLQSKLPSKGKGKNVTIKSKYFIIKKGCDNATDIQGKKGILLTKDARNKWFNPGNTAMLAKKKLARANKFKSEMNNKIRRTSLGSELMAVSRTKLVRKSIPEINRIQKLKTAEYMHEIKLTPSVKMAHRVKNKYKFIRNQLNNINVNAARPIYPKQSQVLQETPRIQSTLKKRIASRILKKRCSLIKIGDAYYRASYNKLTRRTPVKAVGNCGSILKVQGKKYALQRGRQSLKYFRVSPLQLLKLKSSGGIVRPKIGSPNTPWSRVVQAKQRSIALLTNRLRKNNKPCIMFNRFGRCAGKEKGTCNKLHDSKNIAVCKRFVQGCCENPNCPLSHDVGPEKMPTCHHFLAGNCIREKCPYLHVKLSKKAPICLAFLQGYCADAANCRKRHEHMCPEFEEKGVCPKGKYCPYPHPKVKNIHCKSSEQCKTSIETYEKKSVEGEEETKTVVSSCRYFEEATADEFTSPEFSEESIFEESTVCINDEVPDYWINKRCKIGDLPGYIPLMNDSEDKTT